MTARLPAPWTVEDVNDACFIVRAAGGQALAHVYYERDPGRAASAVGGGKLSHDMARRVAANIARLPELLGSQNK